MTEYYLFFRCWPGFDDTFPVDQFNDLPDDQIGPALDTFSKDWLRGNKKTVKEQWQARRKQLVEQRAKAASQIMTRQGRAGNMPASTETTFQRMADRRSHRRKPLVWRVGQYAGWGTFRHQPFDVSAVGPQTWFGCAQDDEFVKELLKEYAKVLQLNNEAHQAEQVLRPVFGAIPTARFDKGQRASILRAIHAIERGEPAVAYPEIALAIARRAMRIEKDLSTAWCNASIPGSISSKEIATHPSSDPNEASLLAIDEAPLPSVNDTEQGTGKGTEQDTDNGDGKDPPTVTEEPQGSEKGKWFKPDDPRDPKYKFGPIECTMKDFARWTSIDRRTLRKLNGKQWWWIESVHNRKYSVWFCFSSRYDEIRKKQSSEKGKPEDK